MAIITDVELTAGFQVRVRWYAQGTQRYPSNENEYYSTFFQTLEPNQDFTLSDPRFVLADINDDPDDLQYVIRDVCHTQTLVPQFVDFLYFNPDYINVTTLSARVNGGVLVIPVSELTSTENGLTIGNGDVIQIGPMQSDIYTIQSITALNVTLTTATTKTFPRNTTVNLSDRVSGRYPDTVPETALARILDNTGSLLTGAIQVTTPLYFDIGETVRRYYYEATLQTPYNGARGSGDLVDQEIPDPNNPGELIFGGWWAVGDMDNEAAEMAVLIDSEGYQIASRDRENPFAQRLYFSTDGETIACTADTAGSYYSDHPDFTDASFTSIVNADGARSIPAEGYYAWGQPTILLTDTNVTLYFGDNQIFSPSPTGLLPISWTGTIEGKSIGFTIPVTATNLSVSADIWEIARVDLEPDATLLGTDVGFVDNIATTSSSFASNRFVRYWNGASFDIGRVDPTLSIDNCPSPLTNTATIAVYATEQGVACDTGGTSQMVFYTTTSTTDLSFSSGNVTGIFTNRFGADSDAPSALGTTYIKFGRTNFFWNGNSLSRNAAACDSRRFCGDTNAVNTGDGDIRDDSLCVYPRTICTDSSATNFVPTAQRGPSDIVNNGVCVFPAQAIYNIGIFVVGNNIAGPSSGYSINFSGNGGYIVGTSWAVNVSISINPGFIFVGSEPSVTYDPASSGPSLTEGQLMNINVTIGAATVEAIPPDPMEPEPLPDAISVNYATSARTSCEGGSARTIFQGVGITSVQVGSRAFSNTGLTSEIAQGFYNSGSSYFSYSPGSGFAAETACPVNLIDFTPITQDSVTASPPQNTPSNPVTIARGISEIFDFDISNPSGLPLTFQWSASSPGDYSISSGGGNADTFIRLRRETSGVFPRSFIVVSVYYTDPNTNSQVLGATLRWHAQGGER